MAQSKVSYTKREIIEAKLLAALYDDSGKVAALYTRDDLEMLIEVYAFFIQHSPKADDRHRELRNDLMALRQQAFGAT